MTLQKLSESCLTYAQCSKNVIGLLFYFSLSIFFLSLGPQGGWCLGIWCLRHLSSQGAVPTFYLLALPRWTPNWQ